MKMELFLKVVCANYVEVEQLVEHRLATTAAFTAKTAA